MGNVYMEADQVRFKDSTYRNVQEGLAAALEGGGGGGTTVVANPEGSATADLAKLQVGTTIYGIPAEAGDISYDNTSSGLTADDVQEAIDEVNTDLGTLSTTVGDSSAGLVKDVSDIKGLIPSGATTSNKLATASDIPDAVTGNPSGSATAGNLTKLQIGNDIYNVPSGGGFTLLAEVPMTNLTLDTQDDSYGGTFSIADSDVISSILSSPMILVKLVGSGHDSGTPTNSLITLGSVITAGSDAWIIGTILRDTYFAGCLTGNDVSLVNYQLYPRIKKWFFDNKIITDTLKIQIYSI